MRLDFPIGHYFSQIIQRPYACDASYLFAVIQSIQKHRYLTVMEKDELTGPNHNEYHNIGETLYCTGQRILELSEEK
jgi:hypothetical protein